MLRKATEGICKEGCILKMAGNFKLEYGILWTRVYSNCYGTLIIQYYYFTY